MFPSLFWSSGRIIVLFLSFLYFSVVASTACYFPDGRQNNVTDYQPCTNIAGQFTMCCATANRGDDIDICSSGGLCQGKPELSGARSLWRESCTDPTWQSPACLKICMLGETLHVDAILTTCPDGSICCGLKNSTCCDKREGIILDALLPASSAASSSSVVNSSLPASVNTPSTTATVHPTSTMMVTESHAYANTASAMSVSSAVALCLSVVFIILLTLTIVAWYIIRRRGKKQMKLYDEKIKTPKPPLTPGGVEVVQGISGDNQGISYGASRNNLSLPPVSHAYGAPTRSRGMGEGGAEVGNRDLSMPRIQRSVWNNVMELPGTHEVHELPI